MSAESLRAYMQRLKSFVDNYQQNAEGIINAHSEDIADLQAKQLAQGIKSTGDSITPDYSPYTIEKKKKKQGLAGEFRFPTWYDSGETYRLLKAMSSSGKYVIAAPTYKLPLLEKRYGNKVLGLTKENGEEFRDDVALPSLQKIFEQEVLG